jgi:hypothetical protein
MKTKMNFSPIAKMSLAAFTLLAASNISVMANDMESAATFERLNKMDAAMEESIRYNAPESETYIVSSEEMEAAVERLEDFTTTTEESLKYTAPVTALDIEEYELQAAIERLESFHLAMEKSIKF